MFIFISAIDDRNRPPMRIVALSDTHNKHRDLEPIELGDVLVHTGDFTNYGKYDEVKDFMDWFSSQPHEHKVVTFGNHELGICPLQKYRGYLDTMELINSYRNVNVLFDSSVNIDGVKFYGTPWCDGEWHVMYRWGFYVNNTHRLKELFGNIPDDTDILLSHVPPHGILDMYNDKHLGCPELLERVLQVKPVYHIFGHIHEAAGTYVSEHTHFINSAQKQTVFDV